MSPGCYTTLRIAGGRARFEEHHLRRLQRDAQALGLPRPDLAAVRAGWRKLAREAFADGEGIVRWQLSRDAQGELLSTGLPRPIGPETGSFWRAITAEPSHPGPGATRGVKLSARLHFDRAAEEARTRGADEALWFDRTGRLVEGSRSNLIWIDANGQLGTPPPERGAVAGIALAIVCEQLPELRHRDLSRRGVLSARAVVALNAVRGACPLASLDEEPLGDESPKLAARLEAILSAAS